jgi:hypothetical protein
VGANAFVLNYVVGGSENAVALNTVVWSDDGSVSTAKITLAAGSYTGLWRDGKYALVDGDYSLKYNETAIKSVGGVVLQQRATDTFFRYYGDVDGDRKVNNVDYTAFCYARAGIGDNRAVFDYDGDGDVDGTDFLQFRGHYTP